MSWDFPVTITGTYRVHVGVDPVAVIRDQLAEYRAFVDESGGADWEKPVAFLCHLIEDQMDVSFWFGGHRQSADGSYLEELRENSWTRDDNDRLEAALAAIPDPNQTVLNLEGQGDVDHG